MHIHTHSHTHTHTHTHTYHKYLTKPGSIWSVMSTLRDTHLSVCVVSFKFVLACTVHSHISQIQKDAHTHKHTHTHTHTHTHKYHKYTRMYTHSLTPSHTHQNWGPKLKQDVRVCVCVCV